jgi:predicted ATPase
LILLFRGYPDRALARNREGLAAASASGHAYTTSQALYLTCWLHQVRGERCAVRERAAALMTLASEHGFSAWSANATMLHGWAVAGDGAAEAGIAQLGQGLAALEAMGVRQHTPSFLGLLAGLHIELENPVEAVRLLDEALARVDRLDERWFEAELYRLKGEALLSLPQSDHARAKTCFAKALEVARGQQAKLWELRAATSLARLRTKAGECAEARDLLAPIYRWFTEGFDTRDLRTARALLDQLR